MTATFNLIDQPWIQSLTTDGELVELGLRDLLRDSHRLSAIHCETPIVSASILPVTLAILHRVFGPRNENEWWALWNQGSFPADALETYFDQWYERFDLFHPERPFYQVRDPRREPQPINELAIVPTKGDILFNHQTPETRPYLTASEAARALLTAHYFRSGGGRSGQETPYFVDAPFKSGVIFFAWGRNLFETLMLNLIKHPADEQLTGIKPTQDDKPIWEKDNPAHPKTKALNIIPPKGYLDYLTWMTNHIWLVPEQADGQLVVREVQIVPAAKMDEKLLIPHKRYMLKEKSEPDSPSWSFLYFRSERALWRDFHTLLPHPDQNGVQPPHVVKWLGSYVEIDRDYPLRLLATGMLSEQANSIFYRQELLPLPYALLRRGGLVQRVENAVRQADEVAERLRSALNTLADNVLQRGVDGKPDSSTRSKLIQQWGALDLYWDALEPPFWGFIDTLEHDQEEAIRMWKNALTAAAREALSRAERMAGDTPWALKGGVTARRYLNFHLRNLQEST